MRFVKTPLLLGLTAAVALLIAGCGSGTSTGTGNSSPTATTVPATATTVPATATTAPVTSALPINTASVSVSGTTKTVLVTAQGVTLYYRTTDTTTSVYSGPVWPPLLSPNGTPTSSASLPGTLSVLTDANGAQVTYNGHPLYTYAGDNNTPGQATGDGSGGIWFVATPSLH